MGVREHGFWTRVNKTEGCWLWTGSRNSSGYGDLQFMGYHVLAHRLSYTLAYGEIPRRMLVLHKCDTPHCVRPDHLFVGTDADNHMDKILKGRDPTRKLSAEQVREVRRRLSTETQTAIAKSMGVGLSVVHQLSKGTTYQWIQ